MLQSRKSEIFLLNEIGPLPQTSTQASSSTSKHYLTTPNPTTSTSLIHRSQTQAGLLDLSADSLINECREGNIENVREILRSNTGGLVDLPNDNQLTVKSVGRRFHPLRLDLETRDDMGHTALNMAARFNHVEICLLLLEHGAKVNTADKDGWTPLMNAAKHGSVELVQAFVDKSRAHLEDRDLGGFTPLTWAVYKNHLECVRCLLKAGADPNSRCKVIT